MAGLDAFKENQEVKVIDETKKVRIGIIGTGWIADSHISAYKNMPDVEVVAMADLIPGKAEAFAKKHGIETSASITATRSCSTPRRILTAYRSAPTTASTQHRLSTLLTTV